MRRSLFFLVVFSLCGVFFFQKTTWACISRPASQPYFLENYIIRSNTTLPNGITAEMSQNDGISVSSALAYPIYILVEAKDPNKIYSRDSITFPKGYLPVSGIVAGRIPVYNESKDSWKVDRTFGGVEPYAPYTYVSLSNFDFSSKNTYSLNPNLSLQKPEDESKKMVIWMNSTIHEVQIVKTYATNPDYKEKVIQQLKADLDRTIERNKNEGSLLKRAFMLLFGRFLPQTKVVYC